MSPSIVQNYQTIAEKLKDRLDINASIQGYFHAEDCVNPPSDEGRNSTEGASGDCKPKNLFIQFTDSLRNVFGNYLVNEESPPQETQFLYAHGPEGDPRTERSSDDRTADAVDEVWEDIENEEFRLSHGGLSRQEWNEFMGWLRANGMGDVAAALEAHPEMASEILDMIANPDTYWDGLRTEAEQTYEADAETRREVVNRVTERLVEELGLTATYYRTATGQIVYQDEDGRYYVIWADENGVHVSRAYMYDNGVWFADTSDTTTYSLHDSRFGLSQEQIDAFDTVDTRVAKMHAENMGRIGLPSSWDPRDVSEAAREGAARWQDRMWLRQDGEYLYVSPEFYAYMERLIALYNLLSLLFMLAKAKNDLRKLVAEIAGESKIEDGNFNITDVAETRRANSMSQSKYLLYTLQRYSNTHNNRIYQQQLNQAREDAYDEAHSWGGWYNYAAEIYTLGGSDSLDRDTESRYLRKKERIDAEYERFQRRVEQQYEQVLGRRIDYNSGDPYGGQIDALMTELTLENLRVNVGNDRWDINRERLVNQNETGIRDRLVDLENLRKLMYILQFAKNKLKQTAAEIATGHELGGEYEGMVLGALNDLNQFEHSITSTVVNTIQQLMGAHNEVINTRYEADRADAMYWSGIASVGFGPAAFLERQLNDYIVESYYYELSNSSDFESSDLQVDLDKLIRDINEIRNESARAIITSDEEAARVLNELEKKQWEIIGALDGDDLIERGDDEFWNLNERRVSELRDDLTALQNFQRVIIMLARAKNRLREIVAKLTLGKNLGGDGLLSVDTFEGNFQNNLLAFELKKSNLQLQIQEHNKERVEYLRKQQAKYKAIGMVVGAVAAVVILILFVAAPFTGGASIVAAIGLIMALSSLGSAIGNITYHLEYQVDEGANDSGDFYDTDPTRLAVAVNERRVDQTIDRLNEESEAEVDRLNRSSHSSIGSGQWGIDQGAFIEVNQALTRIQILIKILTMLEQAKNDLRSIVASATIGVSAQDASDFVKSGMRAIEADRRNALELKDGMVKDIAGAHNRKVMADKDLERSIISASISAASVIIGGTAAAVSDKIGAVEGIMEGLAVSGYVNAAVNLGFAIYDYSTATYGNLSNDRVYELIDEIHKVNRKSRLASLEQAEKDAVSAMGNDLVSDIGGGRVAVNSAAFYKLRDQIERIYTVYSNLATLTQARSSLLKKIAAMVGIPTGREDNTLTELFNVAKDRSMKNLEILRQRVQEYVDRSNQMIEYRQNLFVAAAVAVVTVANVVLKYDFLAGKTGQKWDGALKDKFGEGKTPTAKVAALDQDNHPFVNWYAGLGDGKFSVGDLVGIAVKVLTSQEFAQFVATKLHRATVDSRGGNPNKVVGRSRFGATNALDYYDRKATAEEVALGNVELENERIENQQRLNSEMTKLYLGMFYVARRSIGAIRDNSRTLFGGKVKDAKPLGTTGTTAPEIPKDSSSTRSKAKPSDIPLAEHSGADPSDPAVRPATKPAVKSTPAHADKSAPEPIDKPVSKPASIPTSDPADKPADKTADKAKLAPGVDPETEPEAVASIPAPPPAVPLGTSPSSPAVIPALPALELGLESSPKPVFRVPSLSGKLKLKVKDPVLAAVIASSEEETPPPPAGSLHFEGLDLNLKMDPKIALEMAFRKYLTLAAAAANEPEKIENVPAEYAGEVIKNEIEKGFQTDLKRITDEYKTASVKDARRREKLMEKLTERVVQAVVRQPTPEAAAQLLAAVCNAAPEEYDRIVEVMSDPVRFAQAVKNIAPGVVFAVKQNKADGNWEVEISRVSNAAIAKFKLDANDPQVKEAVRNQITDKLNRAPKPEEVASIKIKVVSERADRASIISKEAVAANLAQLRAPLRQLATALKGKVADPALLKDLETIIKEDLHPSSKKPITPQEAERLIELVSRAAEKANLSPLVKENLQAALKNIQSILEAERVTLQVEEFMKAIESPDFHPQTAAERFAGVGTSARNRIISLLKGRVLTPDQSALIKHLALDTRLTPAERQLLAGLVKSIPIASDPVLPAVPIFLKPEAAEEDKINLLLAKSPTSQAVERAGALAVSSAGFPDRERKREEKKEEQNDALPPVFGDDSAAISAHNQIVRNHKEKEAALV